MDMSHFIESSTSRIAAGIQTIGAGFDPEVLSLPGGSIIAVCLWVYAGTMLTLKRGAARKLPVIESVPTPACAGCLGRH
jgi:hypothetical protein